MHEEKFLSREFLRRAIQELYPDVPPAQTDGIIDQLYLYVAQVVKEKQLFTGEQTETLNVLLANMQRDPEGKNRAEELFSVRFSSMSKQELDYWQALLLVEMSVEMDRLCGSVENKTNEI